MGLSTVRLCALSYLNQRIVPLERFGCYLLHIAYTLTLLRPILSIEKDFPLLEVVVRFRYPISFVTL